MLIRAVHDFGGKEAMDRTLLGGTPEEVPERFEASSPLQVLRNLTQVMVTVDHYSVIDGVRLAQS
ncbi:hypothetical protein [Streptomyces sp. NPDC096012]|uniref:hypothetical protein n=1 Tax=Streptomyces sp. NPDC096012 TaxID=3155684 RepID=UPI00336A0F46